MKIASVHFATGLTQLVSETNGIVSQSANGTLMFQEHQWADLQDFTKEQLAEWLVGHELIYYTSLDENHRPVIFVGIRPDWLD